MGSNIEVSDYSLPFKLDKHPLPDELLLGEGAYTKLFKSILERAKQKNASDIHIEPHTQGVRIRVRILGNLEQWENLDLKHQQNFIMHTKQLTNMSMAIRGREQATKVSYPKLGIELRGSAIPTPYDDKLVYRIINSENPISISRLGFKAEDLLTLKKLVERKSGLILVSGPTGSGKTSTIYALLNEIDRVKNNIITLEDPIERTLDYTTQIKISSTFAFADGLKAAMRQDPDIIFVGEIRDQETAKLAVEAANTGHLVISTVHANDSFGVINRMVSLGVEKSVLKDTLCFTSAQRLIPVLCPKCKLSLCSKKHGDLMKSITQNDNLIVMDKSRPHLQNKAGCHSCQSFGTPGIIARKPIIQYLDKAQIQECLNNPESSLEVKSLHSLILDLVLKGEVCAKELGGHDA